MAEFDIETFDPSDLEEDDGTEVQELVEEYAKLEPGWFVPPRPGFSYTLKAEVVG